MSGLNIGVIGAGLMGHGIAYLLAAAGHKVRIYDPSAQWRESLDASGWKAPARCSAAIPPCSAAFPRMTRWRRR